ncbi:phospholipid phosphatase 4 isoform X4 [Peromyscus californicus insignis]|uniref:phospholipid phosphatase 4 isoform X4 n=1 Tax=Peromyscus californicus insignis TaxID=564181 RepID=UPI0022A70516|nr:phospholipid phosphatase 4 isoform X4 [Peromyscus californicus insignis]XP_052568511.1 phospholipid phosphatase 4 isoform X4 [Peromyscus californicus insignis]
MRELAIEIGVRALLFGVFVFTEFLDPFQRVIQPEEIWLYKNPLVQSDNIPTRLMFLPSRALVSPHSTWLASCTASQRVGGARAGGCVLPSCPCTAP